MRKSSRRGKAARRSEAQSDQETTRHLIETSLLRALTGGSSTFKERINAELGDGQRYTSRYIRMEFRRGLLLRVVQFCLQLQLPSVRSADDLLAYWANHFEARDAKIMVVLCRHLIPRGIDTNSPTTKQVVVRCIAHFALELEARLTYETKEAPDAGHHCKRAEPNLLIRASQPEEILKEFDKFAQAILDTTECRAHCTIDRFLERNRTLFEQWCSEAETVRGDARPAMQKSGPQARRALDKGLKAWTCKDCEKLGDWVIALDCPQYLQVEHLDHIFDHLCPSRGLAHRKHRPDRLDTTPAQGEASPE